MSTTPDLGHPPSTSCRLCKVKAYNNCVFYNVQRNFIVQTGDPTNSGRGGQSINGILYGEQARFFDDEIRPHLKHTKKGVVGMASKSTVLSRYLQNLSDLFRVEEQSLSLQLFYCPAVRTLLQVLARTSMHLSFISLRETICTAWTKSILFLVRLQKVGTCWRPSTKHRAMMPAVLSKTSGTCCVALP